MDDFLEIERPTEFVDLLAYILIGAPDEYPIEDFLGDSQVTNSSAFGAAFRAMDLFIASAKTEEGRERLRECDRNLHVAYEFYEKGDHKSGAQFVQETEKMFQLCRRYISISDE